MVRINVLLNDDLHREAKAHSALRGETLASFVNSAIAALLDHSANQQKKGRGG